MRVFNSPIHNRFPNPQLTKTPSMHTFTTPYYD